MKTALVVLLVLLSGGAALADRCGCQERFDIEKKSCRLADNVCLDNASKRYNICLRGCDPTGSPGVVR
jgi:hypothetical protein